MASLWVGVVRTDTMMSKRHVKIMAPQPFLWDTREHLFLKKHNSFCKRHTFLCKRPMCAHQRLVSEVCVVLSVLALFRQKTITRWYGGRLLVDRFIALKLNLDINPCSCSPKSVGRSISSRIQQAVPFVWLTPPSGGNIANAFVCVLEKYVGSLGTPFRYMRWKNISKRCLFFQWIDLSWISGFYPTCDRGKRTGKVDSCYCHCLRGQWINLSLVWQVKAVVVLVLLDVIGLLDMSITHQIQKPVIRLSFLLKLVKIEHFSDRCNC